MTQEEKSQAQDVLDGLLRDSYQKGYNQGFIDGTHVGGSGRTSKPAPPPPPPPPLSPADGTVLIKEGQTHKEAPEFRACLDCSHCHTITPYGLGLSEKHICRLASKAEIDPVTGIRCYTEKVHCWKEREDGSCGPEGRNFESRQRRFKGGKKGLLDWLFPGMLPW